MIALLWQFGCVTTPFYHKENHYGFFCSSVQFDSIIDPNIKDYYVGLIVDRVEEVTDISDGLIAPLPTATDGSGESYSTGIGKRTNKIILLMHTPKATRQ